MFIVQGVRQTEFSNIKFDIEFKMKGMRDYFMSTSRLGFSNWHEYDIDLALNLWGDFEVTKLINASGKLSEEEVREILFKEIATEKKHGIQY